MTNNKIPEDEINFMVSRSGERILEIFNYFGIDYCDGDEYLHARCPIHCGDNPRAFYWSIRNNTWVCATRQCHKSCATGKTSSIFGLVRGIMYRKTGKHITFAESFNIIRDILSVNVNPKTIKKHAQQIKQKAAAATDRFTPLGCVKPMMVPDTVYYPKRGYSANIIHRYHISYCDNPKKYFYQRSFIPILDYAGVNIVGWSGRSIWEKCDKCSLYHNPHISCPDKRKTAVYGKWRHSLGFKKTKYLYNIWYSKHHINKTKTAIIVESPGNVWSLEQAGIKNSVAVMGCSISADQRKILQKSGALTLILAFDNDDAGKYATETVSRELDAYFRIESVDIGAYNDIGEMSNDEIVRVFNGCNS